MVKSLPECVEQAHTLPMSKIPFDVIPIEGIDTDVKPTYFALVSLHFIGGCAKGRGFTKNRFGMRKNANLRTLLPNGRSKAIAIGDPYLSVFYKVNARSRANILKLYESLEIILVVQFMWQPNALRKDRALSANAQSLKPILASHLINRVKHDSKLPAHHVPLERNENKS